MDVLRNGLTAMENTTHRGRTRIAQELGIALLILAGALAPLIGLVHGLVEIRYQHYFELPYLALIATCRSLLVGLRGTLLAALLAWALGCALFCVFSSAQRRLSDFIRRASALARFVPVILVAAFASSILFELADPRWHPVIRYSTRAQWTARVVSIFSLCLLAVGFSALGSGVQRRLRRGALCAVPAAVATAILLPLMARPARSPIARNIFLVTVDTLRADHLGAYGYPRDTSPNLDRWARSGRVFRWAFAHAPMTGPSLAAVMTGLQPRETGVRNNGMPLKAKVHTLAERLRNRGYRTAAIVGNYHLRRGTGFEDGFESFDDRMEQRELVRKRAERTAQASTQAAIAWLQRAPAEPFFLWVHYQDPHGPYTAPEEFQGAFVPRHASGRQLPVNASPSGNGGIPAYQVLGNRRDYDYYVGQYDAEIRYFDSGFGELMTRIESLGLLRRSAVLFTADHGEGMGEHDYYFAHGEHVYLELLRVPLIVWAEGVTPGVVTDALASHRAISPTILNLTEGDRGGRTQDLLADRGDAGAFAEISTESGHVCSLVHGRTQLLSSRRGGEIQVVDLERGPLVDPTEHGRERNLKGMARLLDLLCQPGATEKERTIPSDPDVLRSLGYLP
jgi:arylsulfatase